jgi:(p)ppGpp synthase/HD superfamily hydrolase
MATLDDAILIAAQAHRGQKDKAGAPYILHPLRLMLRVQSDDERMAAVLHDVVEDSSYTLADLQQAGFPASVIKAVECLTRKHEESYEDFIERVRLNPLARRVKLADLQDNLDIRRLPDLQDKDIERLRKYRQAWSRLMEAEHAEREGR